MILPLLLMLQAAPAPAADAVAIVERLDRWKGSVRNSGGVARCRTSRSTGDAAIDAIGCAAAEACEPQYQSRLDGAIDRSIRPETRKLMLVALKEKLAQCVKERRTSLANDLVARRGTGA